MTKRYPVIGNFIRPINSAMEFDEVERIDPRVVGAVRGIYLKRTGRWNYDRDWDFKVPVKKTKAIMNESSTKAPEPATNVKAHPHAALMAEYAADMAKDKDIVWQYSDRSSWEDIRNPTWSPSRNYRRKPIPKPDVVQYFWAVKTPGKMGMIAAREGGYTSFCSTMQTKSDNVKVTFDGETGKLKAVELI